MQITSAHFKRKAGEALKNESLQRSLARLQSHFVDRRADAVKLMPEFEAIRDAGAAIRDEVLHDLGGYLQRFEQAAQAAGAQVHWAETADEASRIVVEIARKQRVKKIVKSKSMVTEECALNEHLEQAGFEVVETDLGEYILQLAKEPPSHIVAPVMHKSKDEISALFDEKHRHWREKNRPLPSFPPSQAGEGGEPGRAKGARTKKSNTENIGDIVNEARELLRSHFLTADMGVSGANFLVAETGSVMLFTNEGNGRLVTTMPRVHVAIAGIEKIVPTLEDAATMARLLPRSATGQTITNYVSVLTGARRTGDLDGPEQMHIVLLDNGRSTLVGTKLESMLRCIRCGACMNHCPVYQNIGGHAYGWVYPGPMGAVLTPLYAGIDNAVHLPNASTFCGACVAVCPVKIPLTDLMRELRTTQFRRHLRSAPERFALRAWSWFAQHPRLYAWVSRLGVRVLAWFGGRARRLRRLPGEWTLGRDLPAPEGRTFRELYRSRKQR